MAGFTPTARRQLSEFPSAVEDESPALRRVGSFGAGGFGHRGGDGPSSFASGVRFADDVVDTQGDTDTSDFDEPNEDVVHRGTDDSDSSSSESVTHERSRMQKCGLGLLKYISILDWPRSLSAGAVLKDVGSGLTVAIMAIPESMSYANIAGLPYVYGLYIACVAPLVYALFGRARQLSVGPTAMLSLLMRAGLEGNVPQKWCPQSYDEDGDLLSGVVQSDICSEAYAALALTTTGMVGIILLLACLFRLGFLVTFLGHPVISGFTTGSAIIIGLSQTKYFLGFHVPRGHLLEVLVGLFKNIRYTKPVPLCLGLLWLFLLLGSKRLAKKDVRFRALIPLGPLLGCVLGILLVWWCAPLRDRYDVQYVGHVPQGLIPVAIDPLRPKNILSYRVFLSIRATVISAALISFMESFAISQALASQHGYSIKASQELFALGCTNLVASCFTGYAATGSFSRTAVANSTGAQSQLAGIVVGVSMLLVLRFLTPLFYYLPMYTLAAIVMKAVVNLVEIDVAMHLWKVKRWDFGLWMAALLGTLFVGPLEGIGVAVLMSIAVVIYESARPQLTILVRIPGTKIYRSIEQESRGELVPDFLIVRLGASLYFSNVAYVKDKLLKHIADMSRQHAVQWLVLEMTSVHTVDSTAVHTIQEIVRDFRTRGIMTVFAMVGHRVMKTFNKADLVSFLGEDSFFPTVSDAVSGCRFSEANGRGVGKKKSVTIVCSPEVGITNDIHQQYTQVNIFVPFCIPGLVNLLQGVLSSQECDVEGAQVDHNQHTYHVLKSGDRLSTQDMDSVRAELLRALSDVYRQRTGEGRASLLSASPPSLGPLVENSALEASMDSVDLEQAIAAERVKVEVGKLARERLKALEARLAGPAGGR